MQTKTRKPPTEEQRQAAQDRRERIRKLAKVIGAMSETDRLAFASRAGIRTIEGRALSIFNQCLLVYQRETVSVVGGFQQWRKAGRCVRKGEHGMAIWIPAGQRNEQLADDAAVDLEGEMDHLRFILGTVFDVSQTDELS